MVLVLSRCTIRLILGIFLATTISFAQHSYTVKEVPNPKDIDGGWVSFLGLIYYLNKK